MLPLMQAWCSQDCLLHLQFIYNNTICPYLSFCFPYTFQHFPQTTVNMGMSYSTAKWVAPVSFIIDFAAQQYGMFSSPNMLDVHDQNLSFFSPYPYGIAAFFFPQQLFQVAWLYRLYKLNPTVPAERVELDQMVDFVPYYSVGNLCIASRCSPLPLQLPYLTFDQRG